MVEIQDETGRYRAMPYDEYLQTPRWRARRNRALGLAGYQCRRCYVNRGLEVHHVSYDRLGDERDEDLEVLCGGCHLGHHVDTIEDGLAVYRKIISDALREEQFTTIADLLEDVKCRCARMKVPYRDGQIHAALLLMGDKRLAIAVPIKIAALVRHAAPHQPLGHAEAAGIIAKLGAQGLMKHMPSVPRFTQREADKRIAARIVAREIAASIERCEELERIAVNAGAEPAEPTS